MWAMRCSQKGHGEGGWHGASLFNYKPTWGAGDATSMLFPPSRPQPAFQLPVLTAWRGSLWSAGWNAFCCMLLLWVVAKREISKC